MGNNSDSYGGLGAGRAWSSERRGFSGFHVRQSGAPARRHEPGFLQRRRASSLPSARRDNSSELVFVEHPILHNDLEIPPRIGHDPQVAQRIPFDHQQVRVCSGRNHSQISARVEQLGVDASGGADNDPCRWPCAEVDGLILRMNSGDNLPLR